MPGATPKLKKSERESNWKPRSDSLSRCLASIPSRTSHTAANRIQITAKLNSPSIANLIELNPKLKPDKVIKFGIKDLNVIFSQAFSQSCENAFSCYNLITDITVNI